MRFINQLFTTVVGNPVTNREALALFQPGLERLALPEPVRKILADAVAFQLMGDRVRHAVALPQELTDFKQRAAAFERGAEQALDRLAEQILPALATVGRPLDAILTTTATGNLMPGLGYRMARRLGSRVLPETLIVDLANVGCTGGIQLLNLARSLDPALRQILLVAVELPTTLVDLQSTTFDGWQGNCTFGDGAAALWLTDQPEVGPLALAIEELHPRQFSTQALDLIRWAYASHYTFALRDYRTFESEVRALVEESITAVRSLWKDEHLWAIHPAGLALLMRLARPLGLSPAVLKPSTDHYHRHSNMSSVGILHILHEVATKAEGGAGINLVTMGAGFLVIYGRVRRVR